MSMGRDMRESRPRRGAGATGNAAYTAISGRQAGRGVRQSRPSSSMASCAGVSVTVPSRARVGHRNRPCSRRL